MYIYNALLTELRDNKRNTHLKAICSSGFVWNHTQLSYNYWSYGATMSSMNISNVTFVRSLGHVTTLVRSLGHVKTLMRSQGHVTTLVRSQGHVTTLVRSQSHVTTLVRSQGQTYPLRGCKVKNDLVPWNMIHGEVMTVLWKGHMT